MAATAGKLPGISIEVEDLVRLRGRLAGPSLAKIRRRASFQSGARDTRTRGRGMEYEESRAYVPGDDMRTMDWRVMARTGEAHSKIYAEEKERRCLLAVDLSASMFFGTRYAFKSWAAAQAAAHIGWLASFAGDRIGGIIVAPDCHYEVRPDKKRAGLLEVFHHLAAASRIALPPENGASRLSFLLRELHRVVKPGSIIALLSDFVGLDEASLEIMSALARHNDLNAFWIHDKTEIETWPQGYYPVLTAGLELGLDLTEPGQRDQLLQWQRQYRAQIDALSRRFAMPIIPLSCNHDISGQILQHPGLI